MQKEATRMVLKERLYEEEVRRHIGKVYRGLRRGESTELGDMFKAPFKLYCDEFHSRYLDHERIWIDEKKNVQYHLLQDTEEWGSGTRMRSYGNVR
jgi:hypothetical protein